MRTLGIDMASQANKTGIALITWAGGRGNVDEVSHKADDARLDALAGQADVIGIDAPFGWPRPFCEFIAGHQHGYVRDVWSDPRRDELRFRRTDRKVYEHTRRWPLSVSSDLISIPAMRCAAFLGRLGVVDRSGDGRVFEVYPAASLSTWGLPRDSYKGDRQAARVTLLAALLRRTPWLVLADPLRARCEINDDALDALLAALIARAAGLGLTLRPEPDDHSHAREEGWIALPLAGSLERLVDPRPPS